MIDSHMPGRMLSSAEAGTGAAKPTITARAAIPLIHASPQERAGRTIDAQAVPPQLSDMDGEARPERAERRHRKLRTVHEGDVAAEAAALERIVEQAADLCPHRGIEGLVA